MKLKKGTADAVCHGKWYEDACAAAFAMEIVGERWSLLIARELMFGALRFNDIRASLPGISARVLTERLGRLEALGVLARRRLERPASVQVYELTAWGLELEPVMAALGRWAVRSPLHDPALPITPVALMLSLRAMLVPEAAVGLSLVADLVVGEERFRAALHDARLDIRRETGAAGQAPDLTFRAPSAADFLPVFYGKQPLGTPGLPLELVGELVGARALADRFIAAFALPPKVAHG